MRTSLKLVAAAGLLTLVGLAGAVAMDTGASRGVTVGELALSLARSVDIELPDGDAGKAALKALRRAGVILDGEPGRTVTEGDLVKIGKSLGAEISSSSPGRKVGRAKSAAFVLAMEGSLRGVVGSTLSTEGEKEGNINPSCRGRAKRANRKGTPPSHSSPSAQAPPCTGGP